MSDSSCDQSLLHTWLYTNILQEHLGTWDSDTALAGALSLHHTLDNGQIEVIIVVLPQS